MTSLGARSFEEYSKEVGFVTSIEDWAKTHRLNVYVAVYEHNEVKDGIVSEIRKRKATSVLDLGCGYGFLMSKLNRACGDTPIVGGDISRFQVKNAKSRGVRGSLVVCCAEHIPFKNGAFECVVCSEVIEHVVDPKLSLLEMERVLKYGGYLCISTDNPLSIYQRIVKLFHRTKKLLLDGKRIKSVKEEFIRLTLLIEIIPKNVMTYSIHYICPYPLLPDLGSFFGSETIGKSWVSIGEVLGKLPYVGSLFCNKYLVFAVKQKCASDSSGHAREKLPETIFRYE
jgi:ubiquinone/menaquinone biosynthesis C-methylase UbiE